MAWDSCIHTGGVCHCMYISCRRSLIGLRCVLRVDLEEGAALPADAPGGRFLLGDLKGRHSQDSLPAWLVG